MTANLHIVAKPEFYQKMVETLPQKYPACFLYGCVLTEQMREARTGARASALSEKDWAKVYHYADLAEQMLDTALVENDNDPQIFYRMITVLNVAGGSRAQIGSLIERATSATHSHFIVYAATLDFYTKKWGGSYDAMFDFARSVAASGEHAGCMQALIPSAHIERWLGYEMDEQTGQEQYFTEPSIVNELKAAYAIFKQDARQDWFHYSAANHFAVAFYLSKQDDLLEDALRFLDGHYLQIPWCYVSGIERFAVSKALATVGM